MQADVQRVQEKGNNPDCWQDCGGRDWEKETEGGGWWKKNCKKINEEQQSEIVDQYNSRLTTRYTEKYRDTLVSMRMLRDII